MNRARKFAVLTVVAFASFYLLWILFAGAFSRHELLVGAIAAALSVVGIVVVNVRYPARFAPTLEDLLTAWRLCWYLVSGTWEVLLVAARDLVGAKRAQSLFRVVRFAAGKQENPHDTARRVLATLYTTVAPNFIVLGVNASDNNLLFHQIERSSVPKMTQTLGAQP